MFVRDRSHGGSLDSVGLVEIQERVRPYLSLDDDALVKGIRVCVELNMEEVGAKMIREYSMRERRASLEGLGGGIEVAGWVTAAAMTGSLLATQAWNLFSPSGLVPKDGCVGLSKWRRLRGYGDTA